MLYENPKRGGKVKKFAAPTRGAKILLFDIETAPTLGYVWGLWEQNVIAVERDWYILCWAAKWYGQKQVISSALIDFPLYKKEPENDGLVIKALWKLLDEADIVIAQNGDAFDIKKANARFIQQGMEPPAPYKTVDTLKVARRYFKFDSNKLDDLGKYLGVGQKRKHDGFAMWKGCMLGDPHAWSEMVKYCRDDVTLLEGVYTRLRPWMQNHPNLNLWQDSVWSCPNCASNNVVRRGYTYTRASIVQRFHCKSCGAWSQGKSHGMGAIK